MNTDPPADGLTLQGGGLAKGRRQETLAVPKGDLQQQGGVQDREPAARGGLPSSLWTDFQFANIQLAGEFNTAGTFLKFSLQFLKLIFIGVCLLYNVMLVSTI